MNDFVNRYKNSQAGVKPKQQTKDNRKGVTKALHTTFKVAMEGKIAGINHEGIQYLMLKQDLFNQIVQSGGKVLLTEEQQEFNKTHQILLHMMQTMQVENDVERDLFAELDQFTFEFSQFMNDPNAAKKRWEISEEFNKLIQGSELLIEMDKNLRSQLFPDQNKEVEEVENRGKLT